MILTNGGSNAKTLANATFVAGDLTIQTNATFAAGAYLIELLGNWTNNGTFAHGTGTVKLGGAGKFIGGDAHFHNLTVTGSYTMAGGNVAIHGNVNVSGSFAIGTGQVSLDGDLAITGSLSSSGTATFTGTRVQTLQLLGMLQSAGSGVINFNGTEAPVLYSVLAPSFATVNINNTAGIAPNLGWTVYGPFTVASNSAFHGGSSTHTFNRAFINNGTVTSSGTLIFQPTNDVPVRLAGESFSSTGTVRLGGSGQISLVGNASAFNTVAIANTHAAGITVTNNWTLAGDLRINSGATFHAGAGLTHAIAGNVTVDGTLDGQTSVVVFNDTTEITGNGQKYFNHLLVTGSVVASADFNVTGNFTNNGAFAATDYEVTFVGGSAAIITGAPTATAFGSLVIAKTAATVTLAMNIGSLTALTISSGTLALGTGNVLSDASALNMNGGTFSSQGHSETLGALTSQSSSTFILGNSATETLTFASGNHVAGHLHIINWTGAAGVSGTSNRIFMTASPNATFLTNVHFVGYGDGAIRLGTGEIVPAGELATKPHLGMAASFAVLAGSTVTSGGATTVNGDLGVSPGTAVTGTPTVNGTLHQGDSTAAQAQLDLTSAYDDAAIRPGGAAVTGDLGGQTLAPGLYHSATSMEITTGDLILDAQGDPDGIFIFQMGSTFITAIGSKVILTNGAQACNVFWQVGSSVTLGANSVCQGNLLVYTTIGVASGATLEGRALARNGAVNLVANTITVPPCPSGQTITFPAPGDQTYGAAPITLGATASSGLAVSYSVTSGPATVSSNTLTITGAGSVTIQASQAGDANWVAATPVNQTILIEQKSLTVTAGNTNRVYGAANPAFNASYSGFVNGDTVTVITGAPDLSTSANASSAVGSYAITPSIGTLSATNYVFPTFNSGTLTITKASAANVVGSSANPSPTGASVTLTATLAPIAPGSGTPTAIVQFLADGAPLGSPAVLADGVASVSTASLSHGTHTITAEYAGDGNFFGSTNILSPNQVINTGPTAANDSLQRSATSGAKVRIATVLSNDSDADSDVLTFSSVNATSAGGGTVAVSGLWIRYTPLPGLTNSDSFSYVLADSGGLQATGLVSVTILADTAASQNVVAVEDLGNNTFRVRFAGIPGRAYTIQYAENLLTPDWQTLATQTADATGSFEYADTPPQEAPARFYHSTVP